MGQDRNGVRTEQSRQVGDAGGAAARHGGEHANDEITSERAYRDSAVEKRAAFQRLYGAAEVAEIGAMSMETTNAGSTMSSTMDALELAVHRQTEQRERAALDEVRKNLENDLEYVRPLYEQAKALEAAHRGEIDREVDRLRRLMPEAARDNHALQVKWQTAIAAGVEAQQALDGVATMAQVIAQAEAPTMELLQKYKDWMYPPPLGGTGAVGFLRLRLHQVSGTPSAIARTHGVFAEALKKLPRPPEPASDELPPLVKTVSLTTNHPIDEKPRPRRSYAKSNISHEHRGE
jgi:hypothetical protein